MAIAGGFKVSFFWKQQSSLEGGWSENYWNSLTSAAAVSVLADALRVAWYGFKGNPTFCPAFRMSDLSNPRNVMVVTNNSTPITPTPDTDADYPTTKGLLKLSNVTGSNTKQWVGGLRDVDVTTSGRWTPTPDSVTKLAAVITILSTPAAGWSIRVLNPAVPRVAVISFNANTGVLTSAANTIADGSRVRVQGTHGVPFLNGIWRVTKLTDTTFSLNGWIPSTFAMTKSANPTIRFQDYILSPISAGAILRTTSHRVGRPFGLLGGRRRRRAS